MHGGGKWALAHGIWRAALVVADHRDGQCIPTGIFVAGPLPLRRLKPPPFEPTSPASACELCMFCETAEVDLHRKVSIMTKYVPSTDWTDALAVRKVFRTSEACLYFL